MSGNRSNIWWICQKPGCNPPGLYNRFKADMTTYKARPICPCCQAAGSVRKQKLGDHIANRIPVLIGEMVRA